MDLIKISTLVNYAIAVMPFFIVVVSLCVKLERRITRIEVDIKWVKNLMNLRHNTIKS